MTILASDPSIDSTQVHMPVVEVCALGDPLQRSDFVSVHVPLTTSTRRLIDESKLRLMKPSAFLINTSRGGVIDHESLFKALSEGWIAGAGLDVFEPERLAVEPPLLALPNLIATPHVAFYSEESVLELQRKAARKVVDVLLGRLPESVVNPTVLSLPRWAHLIRSSESPANP